MSGIFFGKHGKKVASPSGMLGLHANQIQELAELYANNKLDITFLAAAIATDTKDDFLTAGTSKTVVFSHDSLKKTNKTIKKIMLELAPDGGDIITNIDKLKKFLVKYNKKFPDRLNLHYQSIITELSTAHDQQPMDKKSSVGSLNSYLSASTAASRLTPTEELAVPELPILSISLFENEHTVDLEGIADKIALFLKNNANSIVNAENATTANLLCYDLLKSMGKNINDTLVKASALFVQNPNNTVHQIRAFLTLLRYINDPSKSKYLHLSNSINDTDLDHLSLFMALYERIITRAQSSNAPKENINQIKVAIINSSADHLVHCDNLSKFIAATQSLRTSEAKRQAQDLVAKLDKRQSHSFRPIR